MAKLFAIYEEMQQTVDIMSTMISTDHKRRLVFYRERATNRSVRTIRTAIINLVTDEVTALQTPFKMDGPTNDPLTPMAKWKGFRQALSRFFFTRIARKPALMVLANDRDLDSLERDLPELGYLLEFNKFLKRGCFTNIAVEDMESKDGWPTKFMWSATHRYNHSVRKLLVSRTLQWVSDTRGFATSALAEIRIGKHAIGVQDNGKLQYLSFALTYPVAEWPTVDALMKDPQIEPLVELLVQKPMRAG